MQRRIELTDRRWTSATAIREALVSTTRETRAPVAETHAMILGFCRDMGMDVLPVPPEAAALAIDAYARFRLTFSRG